jgi:Mlc titration factor MtfA (ptsG expression regulator)
VILLFAAGLGVGAVACMLSYYGHSTKKHRYYSSICKPPEVLPTEIVYTGRNLEWDANTLHLILSRSNHYYNALGADLQKAFLRRVRAFMRTKTFIIKDEEAFREMPVLVSAAAVQVTFGLQHYRFPFYKYIRLYPEAYSAAHTFHLLAGNVEGNTITVAWSHFLEGYRNGSDGVNVGLHEMSHALYCQKVCIEEGYARRFSRQYKNVESLCTDLLAAVPPSPYFSFPPETPVHEAWALSVEHFFERPLEFHAAHPQYYGAICALLHQDPRQRDFPILRSPLSAFFS